MKKYRPASWSQQAREMCDIQIEMVRRGYTTVEDVMKFLLLPIVLILFVNAQQNGFTDG